MHTLFLARFAQKTMKQVLFSVEDDCFDKFMGLGEICPGVEVLAVSEVAETRTIVDRCVAMAINELREDDVFKFPGDYSYILLGINQELVKGLDYFVTPLDFLDYLKEIGIDNLPGRNTIYDGKTRTFGKFPDWTFKDSPKHKELLRRRNVFARFLSAYNRARIKISDGFSDSE